MQSKYTKKQTKPDAYVPREIHLFLGIKYLDQLKIGHKLTIHTGR